MRSRKRTSSSGRWLTSARRRVSHSTSAGIPKPTASTSGAAAADLLDGLEEDVERLLAVRSAPQPMDAVMHDEVLVYDPSEKLRSARIDTDDPPWRHGG